MQESSALSTPAAPTVTPTGTTGATSYSYKIVARNRDQISIASAAGTTATGNATLTSVNYNALAWTAVSGADSYDVYRTVGGATTGLIATVGNVAAFGDTGLTGGSETAPTAVAGGAFWTDAELLTYILEGAKDLWRALLDLHQEHFMTVDATNVSLAASTATITGTPADTLRVLSIEPRDLSVATGTGRYILFQPADYQSPEFVAARSRDDIDPNEGGIIYYAVAGAGSPVAAPTIYVAPEISSALNLRLVYIPTLSSSLAAASNNPIPGESDLALKAWCIAYAKAKERDDGSPDPNWLAIYATEKQSLLTVSTPRQEQEPRVVRGVFDAFYGDY